MIRIALVLLSVLTSINFYSQNLKYRDVDYYFEILNKIELKNLKDKGLLDQNLKIAPKYKKKGKNEFNEAGQNLYLELKISLLKSYFKDYLYQQHLEYKGEIYVLYFSMAGFDDLEWCILKWKKQQWKSQDKVDKQLVEDSKHIRNKNFEFLCFNYDEGPKNKNDVKIFIKEHYLVLSRGGLYHSLFDLRSQKLLINESCPYCESQSKSKKEMNVWIKKNLHDKIDKIINS